MKKQLISTLLTAALVVSTVVPAAAAGAQSEGSGTVYAPTEIIDVVVPTSVKIAFNPLKVAVKNDDFNASSEILSGTYAIQNRSTVPMQVEATFKVTAGDAALVAADKVATDNVAATAPTKAEFSLDVVTTANGAAPTLPTSPAAKAEDATDDSRADAAMDGNASTNKIAIGKASAVSTPLSASTGEKIKFMLNKGPYSAVYDKESDDIIYKANSSGSYDSVAFKFIGSTLSNASLWDKVATAPKVDVTYTLTQSTQAQYAVTPFSPDSRAVVQEKADVVSSSSATGKYTFAAKPTLTMDKADPTQPAASNNVKVLSLIKGSTAVKYGINDFGTYAEKTDSKTNVTTYTYALNGDAAKTLEKGFYKVTVGGEVFILQVK